MKSFIKARVSWVTDSSYLGTDRRSPMDANVFINGNAAVINAPAKDDPGAGMERVDRLLGVVVNTGGKDRDQYTEVTGRSEFLRNMGLHPDDQIVTVRIKGGKCVGC